MEQQESKYLEKMERQSKALALARKMLDDCAADMLEVGIPIRPDRIWMVVLNKIKDSRACCYYKMDEDGEYSFIIIIEETFAKHMHKPEVVENVRNSIYHELLHTCPDSQSHNETFMRWSGVCDEKLGTITRHHMEKPFYYKTTKAKPFIYECANCGSSYYSVTKHTEVICELCSEKMELRQDH